MLQQTEPPLDARIADNLPPPPPAKRQAPACLQRMCVRLCARTTWQGRGLCSAASVPASVPASTQAAYKKSRGAPRRCFSRRQTRGEGGPREWASRRAAISANRDWDAVRDWLRSSSTNRDGASRHDHWRAESIVWEGEVERLAGCKGWG